MAGTPNDPLATAHRSILGGWRRVSGDPAGKPYPDTIEFREPGLYSGRRGADGTDFTLWDAGSFALEAKDRVRLSTANDAEIPYAFRLEGDRLTLRDPEGEEIVYERRK